MTDPSPTLTTIDLIWAVSLLALAPLGGRWAAAVAPLQARLLKQPGLGPGLRARAAAVRVAWRELQACASCGHQAAWHQRLPLLAWLWQRGRCAACQTPQPPWQGACEALGLGLGVLCLWGYGPGWVAWAWLLFHLVLLACGVSVLQTGRMAWATAWLGLGLGLLLSPWQAALSTRWVERVGGVPSPLADAPGPGWQVWLGAGVTALLMGGVLALQKRWAHHPLARQSGWEEVVLLSLVSAWMGWRALPAIVLLTCVLGGVQAWRLRPRGQPVVALAPALGLAVLFYEGVHHVY